jgi:hypothetical protein
MMRRRDVGMPRDWVSWALKTWGDRATEPPIEVLVKESPTKAEFPRSSGTPKKRPLF